MFHGRKPVSFEEFAFTIVVSWIGAANPGVSQNSPNATPAIVMSNWVFRAAFVFVPPAGQTTKPSSVPETCLSNMRRRVKFSGRVPSNVSLAYDRTRRRDGRRRSGSI